MCLTCLSELQADGDEADLRKVLALDLEIYLPQSFEGPDQTIEPLEEKYHAVS